MRKIRIIAVLALCTVLLAQSGGSKKRKVYRTQWGTMITAPETPEKDQVKKSKSEMEKIHKRIQAKLNKTSKKHHQEMEGLREDYDSQMATMQEDYNYQISKMQEQIDLLYHLTQKKADSVFVFNYDSTIVYDTTTVFDTTFIYTNATTTVYDTAVFYDSLYVYNYDTTTIVQTNFDTVVVYDTSFVNTFDTTFVNVEQTNYDTTVVYDSLFIFTYDTTYVRDTLWVFAYDTTSVYDTSWVFAYDTTFIRDSMWVFAYDTMVVYDTTTVVNNDTVTIHTYATNFKPEMIDGQQTQFPVWKTMDDAIQARNAGDKRAQSWINEALYAADGDWNRAKDEYKKFQRIYSSATVKSILRQPSNPNFIGPREEMKYRSVTYDTLRIITFDTLVVQDTLRDLVRQTVMSYDTSVVNDHNEVIKHTTPPEHEMVVRYHDNGRIKEQGFMKGRKRNGVWSFYSTAGKEIRKTTYDMGQITEDVDLNNGKNTGSKKREMVRPKALAKAVHTKYDTPPRPKSRIVPVVDVIHEGTFVTIQFQVDREGQVQEANVIKSSAIVALDQAAVRAVKNTDFHPAAIKGVPTAVWTELEILFPANSVKSVLSPGITRADFQDLYLSQVGKALEKEGIEFSDQQQDEFLENFQAQIEETYSEIEAIHMEEEAAFLKNEIQNFIFHMDNEEGTLQSGVQLYRATSESRITLIDRDGTVLADSHLNQDGVEAMDKHDTRPEILAAKISEYGVAVRHSETLQKKLLYVAHAVDKNDDDRRIYVRFSKPLDEIREQRALRVYEQEVITALAAGKVNLEKSNQSAFLNNYTKGLKGQFAERGYGADIEGNEEIIRSYTDKLEAKSQEIAGTLKREIDTFITYLRSLSTSGLQSSAASYAQSADVRVTLIDSKGVVRADSDMDLLRVSQMDNHINRLEVAQSNTLPYGTAFRYSNTLQRRFVYVTRRLPKVLQEVQYVRLARSLRADYSQVHMAEDELLDLYVSLIEKSFGRAEVNFSEKQRKDFSNSFQLEARKRNRKVRMNSKLKHYRLYIEEINQGLDAVQLMLSVEQENLFAKVYRENVVREFSASENVNVDVNEESIRTYLKNLAAQEERRKKMALKEGPIVTYHDNGRVKEKGEYIAGRKEGVWQVYSERGKLVQTVTYKKGKVVTTAAPEQVKDFATYHDNGRIKEQGITKNSKRDGEWKLYDNRGELEIITVYDQGKIIRQDRPQQIEKVAEYHDNGRIKAQGFIKDGQKDGVWKLYSSRGKLVKSVTYANGKIIRDEGSSKKDTLEKLREGAYMTFHDNGRVQEKGNFEKNKKTGEWREYDDRGTITAITIYEKGQVLFTQNPNMVKSYTSYHNNGRIKEQGMLKGTVRNGEWRLYGKRGKLLRKTNYYQGKIVDQNSTRIIDSFVTYHNNGFVKEEGILKMGQRDGIWMMYDDDGDHVETVTYNNGKVLSREKV